MYTLYTQAPTETGGGVFVRTGTRFQATEKNQWLRKWLRTDGLQIDIKSRIV